MHPSIIAQGRQTLRKLQHLSARLEALVLELNDIRQELVAETIPMAEASAPVRSQRDPEPKPPLHEDGRKRPAAVHDSKFKDYPELDEASSHS